MPVFEAQNYRTHLKVAVMKSEVYYFINQFLPDRIFIYMFKYGKLWPKLSSTFFYFLKEIVARKLHFYIDYLLKVNHLNFVNP